ncbi:DUF4932 domain-containing protein [Flavobacterium gyeonganense]|uniref:DUF4932 domain-containing protein n=1 Tax=Flavobacterium gyeonganense TaxID=1310418 RepID=A0ABV5H9I1_9FLAO|nr:DUF4932 domain-containing protein [Flavobacterium gyeonganense]
MRKNFLLAVLLNLASMSIYAQEKFKEVNFDEKFKKENQGKAEIKINEVKELIHIMIAITEVGLENDDMVAQTGTYYKDIIQDFKPFKDEQIITKFDSLMKANPLNYIFLSGNALSYDFKGNKLVANKYYLFPAQNVSSHTTITVNPITTYKKEIENFAKKTGFRKFYKKHNEYYNKIISDYNEFADLKEQWSWLEKQFSTIVNNYTIMCSPLINGLNYTTSYTDNNFKQIMMVLPPLEELPNMTDSEKVVFNTRTMFTEIDHNYVGKPTKDNIDIINQVLGNREEWVNTKQYGTEYYPNAERVFDEYMTYGVFLLYCKDHFDKNTTAKTTKNIIDLMTERGFIKMQEFADSLFDVSSKNPNKTIEEWYPEFIKQLGK